MPEFHTEVMVRFKMIDPQTGGPYDPYKPRVICPGCDESVSDDAERHYITGGTNTGTIARLWHERCFLEAAADPEGIWLLMAQQIARKPHEFTSGAIRAVLNQLVRIASGVQAAEGRIDVQAARPHLYEREHAPNSYWTTPEDGPDGAVIFKRCPVPF